jgi:hypothetical protein
LFNVLGLKIEYLEISLCKGLVAIVERAKYHDRSYINTNFYSSDTNANESKSSDRDNKENIVILKKVNSIRQLRNSDKQLVRLCYKEAILKGFTIVKDIQCYIASKSKIWVERTGIEYLKKSEEEENKKWYHYLARDHFAYVGVYRKTFDEIEQCKKDLWSMMMAPDTTNIEKVQIIKELHNLTKTSVLLLRDLPFVTNLSKYYNTSLSNSAHDSQPAIHDSGAPLTNQDNEKAIERKVSERLAKLINESGLYNDLRNNPDSSSLRPDHKITDEVMDDMQIQMGDECIVKYLNSNEYKESVSKIGEILGD